MKKQIDRLLAGWARKHNVSKEKHNKYKEKIFPLLKRLFADIPKGERPSWMDELTINEKDSFSYTLKFAEDSYVNMVETSENCDFIKKQLTSHNLNKELMHSMHQSLLGQAFSFSKSFSALNQKYQKQKDY